MLAPDSICFEDRRRIGRGIESLPETDWYQHYNAMAFRIVRGDTLARKVLADAATAFSVSASLPEVNPPVGELGHSYGGNTVQSSEAVG